MPGVTPLDCINDLSYGQLTTYLPIFIHKSVSQTGTFEGCYPVLINQPLIFSQHIDDKTGH